MAFPPAGMQVSLRLAVPGTKTYLTQATQDAPQHRSGSACEKRSARTSAVDLLAHDGDGLLVDLRGVPGFDGGEIRLAGLVARAGPPAMGLQEIGRRVQRVGGDVEIAGAVFQHGLRQKLGLAELAMHGAAGLSRQHVAGRNISPTSSMPR